jgi:serine/threonine protein phosphatase PrpC
MSTVIAPGYTIGKTPIIFRDIPIPYTEDAHAEFSVEGYDVIIIADGHGNSYEVSKQAVALAKLYFKDYLLANHNDIVNTLQRLIEFINSQLTKEGFPQGGCTFNIAAINKATKQLTVANLGDSHLLVLRRTPEGPYAVLRQTDDHDAGNPSEQTRIRSVNPRAEFTNDKGTIRFHGLAVVRGFGDHSADVPVGVIGRIPDIIGLQLQTGDLIIQSSDGLYEYFNGNKFSGNVSVRVKQITDFINTLVDLKQQIGTLASLLLDNLYVENVQCLRNMTGYSYPKEQVRDSLDNQSIHAYLVE